MALPMDSLTLMTKDAGPGDMGSSLGSSMPGFAPLAMPAQSFRRFSRRDRRALDRAAPRQASDSDPSLRFRRRLRLDGVWRRADVQGCFGRHDHAAGMGDGRPLRRHVLLGDAFADRQHRRLCLDSRSPGPMRAAAAAQREDGGRDADLQRGALARVRRDAGDFRGCRTHRAGSGVRLLPALRHDPRQCLDRGGARVRGHAGALASWRASITDGGGRT